MRSWRKTFIAAFTAQVLANLGFSFAMPFLPFFIAELGVADAGEQALWAGIVLASAGVTFVLFAPFWGMLADRHGRKPMVCRAMFGGAAVLLLMSWVRSLGQLVACRLLQGAFTGTAAASVALVASVVPRERSGFALGMMQTAVFLGSTLGPLFGGVMADTLGYRAAFRGGALLCLLGGLLVGCCAREDFRPAGSKPRAEQATFGAILASRGFLPAVTIMFGVQFGNTLINPSFPLIVAEILPGAGNLNSVTGAIVAGSALAGAVSAAVLGHAGDRFGHRRVLIGACCMAVPAAAGHYWAHSLGLLVAARLLFGLAVASMLPAANAMIHAIIDQGALGRAYGLATSFSMVGVALGPFMGGCLARHAGLRVPFLITAAVQSALCLLIFAGVRKDA
jgi:DHA1 family multidrug resistance protein-like MFS transporter